MPLIAASPPAPSDYYQQHYYSPSSDTEEIIDLDDSSYKELLGTPPDSPASFDCFITGGAGTNKRRYEEQEEEECLGLDPVAIFPEGTVPILHTPETFGVAATDLAHRLAEMKKDLLLPYEDEPWFPWLLKDLGQSFDKKKCTAIFHETQGPCKNKMQAMLDYMNRFHCCITGCQKTLVVRKEWDYDKADWQLITRSLEDFPKEFSNAIIVVQRRARQQDEDDWLLAEEEEERSRKPRRINPGSEWLRYKYRFEMNEFRFDPPKHQLVMKYCINQGRLSENELRELHECKFINTFTGLALEPYLTHRLLEGLEEERRLTDSKIRVKAYFVDDNSDVELRLQFPFGTVLTQYDFTTTEEEEGRGLEYIEGPPHPSNPKWPEHRQRLIDLAYRFPTSPAGKYLGPDFLDQPDPLVKEKHLLAHFGRVGDPWGDSDVSLAPWLEFVYLAICKRNKELFDYVLGWCASLICNLGNPSSVCLSLFHHVHGGGKSLFCQVMASMIGRAWVFCASDATDILGQFNDCVDTKLLVLLDEVKIAYDDTKQYNNLKHIMTSGEIRQRKLYSPAKMVKKWFSFMMTSNSADFMLFGQGERRQCPIKIHDGVNGKGYYLSAIYRLMHGDGRFYHTSKQNWDSCNGYGTLLWMQYLSQWYSLHGNHWNEWPIPALDELYSGQVHSMDVLTKWWHSCLSAGQLKPTENIMALWPREGEECRKFRRQRMLQYAFQGVAHSPGYADAAQEYLCLINESQSLARAFSDDENKRNRLEELHDVMLDAHSWEILWPKSCLLELASQATRQCTMTKLMNHLKRWLCVSEVKELQTPRFRVISPAYGTDTFSHIASSRTARTGSQVKRLGPMPPPNANDGAVQFQPYLPQPGDAGAHYHGYMVTPSVMAANTLMPLTSMEDSDGIEQVRIYYISLPNLQDCRTLFARCMQWPKFFGYMRGGGNADTNEEEENAPWHLMQDLGSISDSTFRTYLQNTSYYCDNNYSLASTTTTIHAPPLSPKVICTATTTSKRHKQV